MHWSINWCIRTVILWYKSIRLWIALAILSLLFDDFADISVVVFQLLTDCLLVYFLWFLPSVEHFRFLLRCSSATLIMADDESVGNGELTSVNTSGVFKDMDIDGLKINTCFTHVKNVSLPSYVFRFYQYRSLSAPRLGSTLKIKMSKKINKKTITVFWGLWDHSLIDNLYFKLSIEQYFPI